MLAVQPDRGADASDRRAGYHDPDLPPCHDYVAFHLWLRHVLDVHAMIHLGTHGTLEWLPGKAVALAADVLSRAHCSAALPVIYPFIVNNPGEAAAAKRRLGAVTIGHLTPPHRRGRPCTATAAALERLIDEYAAADGLDRRRAALLRREILERAAASGLLAESGVARRHGEDDALARLDAYLCDVKELRLRDGLHVFRRDPPRPGVRGMAARLTPVAALPSAALLAALDGRSCPRPGGRADARAAPTCCRPGATCSPSIRARCPPAPPWRSPSSAAEELLRRHRQDHGDWPRTLVLDLWGSATMRTGGEDFALALMLLGVRPVWDDGSARVCGFEVLPLACWTGRAWT